MLFDTHAHLDDDQFHGELDVVIARARAAGVESILAVATTAVSSAVGIGLAEQYAGVWTSVGIHPNYAGQAGPGDWDQVVRLAGQPSAVALGETGLDRHWDHTPWEVQQDYFDRHLRLSQQTGLPIVIHSRECDAEIMAMLRDAHSRGPLTGVMHSFTGTAEMAAECLAMGLYISFAGMVTFKKSDALRRVAATVPADRILVETDSPYLSPHPFRGKRNEPAHVVHTAHCLAQVRGLSFEDFAAQTTANARRIFGRMDR
jgi:TatD DNase family protein